MKKETIMRFISVPTAKGLCGARRVAMMLLMTMLTSVGAWAVANTHFPIYDGDLGTEAKPYQIKSATDLNKLAEDVNNGTSYEGYYFKVTAPINYTYTNAWNVESDENNFTAIGTWNKSFKGTFDGNHQTISGIRIYKGGNDFTNDCYLGIFGCISGSAVVKDITLTNTRITGFCQVAGIVGIIPENNSTTVSGCVVGDNVAIHTKEYNSSGKYSYSHGGIVGFLGSGTVSGCFSAATLTVDANVSSTNYYNSHGAIIGDSSQGTTLSNNYYGGSVNGVFAGVGLGVLNSATTSDVTENNGALPVGTISLTNSSATSITSSATITYAGTNYYLVGAEIGITITVPDGNMLKELSVVDVSSNAVTVTGGWYTNNAATFTMPAGNATVAEPEFTTDFTSLYINMPKTGTVNATIPTGVTTFKIYDDGGSTGTYSKDCDGTLVLTTAIANDGFQLSGHIQAGFPPTIGAYLTVYDGNNNTATKLIDGAWGNPGKDLPTVVSSGSNMTIYFQSNHSGGSLEGFNLTATLVDVTTKYNVSVASATGGVITPSQAEAIFNQPITLTATPQSDYILSDLSVKDGSNNDVTVDWDLWANTATFTMPSSAVTVTPTFTDNLTAVGGLYVNMPTTGTKTVIIPTIVQSFKVYDDGGSTGNYSNNCNGTLVLTAPMGYVLRLSGSITTYNSFDYLTVYDSDHADNDKKLLNKVNSFSTPVTSTGNTMTINFYSNDQYNAAGLDLTVTLVPELELADNADNTTVIDNNDEVTTNVTLQGRTLYCDGDWNTLTLPFPMTAEQIAASPLADFTIKELDGTNSNLDDAGKLTLNFETAYDPTDAPTGSIVAGKPYIVKYAGPKPDLIIHNATEWNDFASKVNDNKNPDSYQGKLVKLADDFDNSTEPVSTWVGNTSYESFNGTFDGNGRTLTVNINSTDDYTIGLFRYVKGATIKNLRVAGSITTQKATAGGLVGNANNGTVTIQNCISSVAITGNYSSTSSNGVYGGLIGVIENGTVTISNSLFNGQLLQGSNVSNTGGNGGFVGNVYRGSLTLTNCLFAPSATITMNSANSYNFASYRSGYEPTLTKCYYKTAFGTAQGTDASGMTNEQLLAADALGFGWEISGGNIVPKMPMPAPDIVNPKFTRVTIDKTAPTSVSFTNNKTTGNCQFVGSYAPFDITDANRNDILLMAAGNKLGYAKTDRTLGAFRAYFDIPSVANAPAISSYELNFGEDDENTTGIINIEHGTLNIEHSAGAIYDLQGRRVENPTKGLYIVNGRKVIIK